MNIEIIEADINDLLDEGNNDIAEEMISTETLSL
jgi:hypothetical protein